jgi:hemoglobin
MGSEIVLRRLVDRFYDLMDEDPDYFGIRKLHPQELSSSRQKLVMFLSGWTGGPSLYVEKYCEPRLRSLPFVFFYQHC